MFLKGRRHPPSSRSLLILLLVFAVLFSSLGQTWAQSRPALLGSSSALPSSSTPASSGIVSAICEPPPICFQSKEARQAYAQQHQCQFLEDVCEKTPASADNQGAPTADQGFWSGLWGSVSSGLTYGYEFGKGLFSGLKGQITDIIDLISNPLEVAQGLAALGKAFYDDPKGTLILLGELLGQGAVDTITKATQCGAYDLGKVIGSYVSPAVMLKLATRLGKYSGKLGDAVKATKLELGCASFAAGTLVWTAQGMVPIETVAQGTLVASRHDALWSDAPQRVDNTFGRMAPSYRVLRTEFESIRLTDEHPLWVQGKGWTAAQDLTDEDVLASAHGDALVLENTPVAQPLRVYNFSVDQTHNYFVGASGLWAHNAKCAIVSAAKGAAAAKFESIIAKMPASERVGFVKVQLREISEIKGWKKRGDLSQKNGGREIHQDVDGNYFAFDTQHGRFEKLDKKGKHLGEYDIDMKYIENSIDKSGGHDINL